MIELKPCPFCGNKKIYSDLLPYDNVQVGVVYCITCGAQLRYANTGDHSCNADINPSNLSCGKMLRLRYEQIAGTQKSAILPLPVKQVDGVSVETWTVKQWFQKINEELDEFKESVLEWYNISGEIDCIRTVDGANIADEAADTITSIISMSEAMGITEQERQEAQKRVNERNKERGRL